MGAKADDINSVRRPYVIKVRTWEKRAIAATVLQKEGKGCDDDEFYFANKFFVLGTVKPSQNTSVWHCVEGVAEKTLPS